MTDAFPRLPALRPAHNILIWVAAAGIIGLIIATQPIPVVFTGGAVIILALLAAITPLAALTALLILAPLRTLIATEAAIQLPLDIGQMALAVFLGVWIMYRTARGQQLLRFQWTPIAGVILVFIALTALSAFSATSLGAWLNEWLKWVQILLLIVLVHEIANGQRWRWLIFGLVLAGVANALVGLYQFFGGSGALHLVINDRFFRAFGTFGQPNPFGGFMGLLAPVAVMAAFGSGWQARIHWRMTRRLPGAGLMSLTLFYAAAAILIVIGIGISWSRGAWLAFAASLGVVALALPHQTWKGLLIAGIAVGVIGLLWLADVLPTSVVDRITSSTQEFLAFEDMRGVDITPENYAVVERLAHWQAALNMFQAHPWLGVGFGNYEVVYPQYRLINWNEPLGHAHNYYLNLLAETGIIGLLGYGKVWLVIMWANWRAKRHPDRFARCVVVGLLGAWTYLGVHSFFDNLYVNNLFLHLGLMLGVLAILYNQTRTQTRLGVL